MLKFNSALLVLTSTLLLSIPASSWAESNSTIQTVTFTGQLNGSTCSLTPNLTGTLDLKDHTTLDIPKVSDFGPSSSGDTFIMYASGCPANTAIALEVGGTTKTVDGKSVLVNTGDAHGVAVALGDVNSNDVISPSEQGTNVNLASCTDGADNGCIAATTAADGSATWNLAAMVVSDGLEATAGSVTSEAVFQLVYQ